MRDKKVKKDVIAIVAKLIIGAVQTAPKARGESKISAMILNGKEKDRLVEAMKMKSKEKTFKNVHFLLDAESLNKSDIVVLIGVRGTKPKKMETPLNCGGCGYRRCIDFLKRRKTLGEDFRGPCCIFHILDLGIALGVAVKVASEHCIDNRMMYTIGAAAKKANFSNDDIVIGIPLSISSKNIFFDRQ